MKDQYPVLWKQLHQDDNPGIDLDAVYIGMREKLNWRCHKHTTCDEHVWESKVGNRIKGNECIFCYESPYKKLCRCIKPIYKEEENIDKTKILGKGEIESRFKEIIDEKEKQEFKETHYKLCPLVKCYRTLPLTSFYISKGVITSNCKTCLKKNTKKPKNLKWAMIRLFFNKRSCTDCKLTDTVLFECDHIDDNKSKQKNGNKNKGMSFLSVKKIPIELKKCEVVCCYCHRLRTIKRYADRKRDKTKRTRRDKLTKFVNDIKLKTGHCFDCKRTVLNENVSAFDYDHLKPEEKVDRISKMIKDECDEKVILAEIEKCQLVCANCHRIRTAIRSKRRKLCDFPPDVIEKARKKLGDLVL